MPETREELQVEGIHCTQCVRRIGEALAGLPGLVAASANLAGDVTVVLAEDDEPLRAEIRRRLTAAGYPPVLDGAAPTP